MKKDKFLTYYNQELEYLQHAGSRFAEVHPKIAQRLKIDSAPISDPHTARLIESFAFLTARINYKIDQNFAELASRLLDILYPHMTRPIPATTIAQVTLQPSAYETLSPIHFDRHHSFYAISGFEKLQCRFRSVYPLTVWPIHIEKAEVRAKDPLVFPKNPATTFLSITLTCKNFSKLNCDELLFHIASPLQKAAKIYQALFQHTTNTAWLLKDGSTHPVSLGAGSLTPVGLDEDDVILPSKYGSNFSYHLLQEFFVFPEKFMFFRCKNLQKELATAHEKIQLFFPISAIDPLLISEISGDDFCINDVPIVNLFSMKSDPIVLDHTQMEYRLSPQENYDSFYEVYDVTKVECTRNDISLTPFFDIHHKSGDGKLYWTTRRDSAQIRGLVGSDVFMSFVTHDFKPIPEDQLIVYAEILATNRDLTDDIQKNTLFYSETTEPFDQIRCTTQPRAVPYEQEDGAYLWKLIAQLSLNHMNFSDPKYALEALQEVLRLHAHRTNNTKVADCIEKVEIVPTVRRLGEEHWRGFVRGMELVLHMKNFETESHLLFLLSLIIHVFLCQQVGINSFVSLKIVDAESKEIMTWHPKAGLQRLI